MTKVQATGETRIVVIKEISVIKELQSTAKLSAKGIENYFEGQLENSLKAANDWARDKDHGLAKEVYDKLSPWPTDLGSYVGYLYGFAQWVPKETTEDHQEAYDRLCQFYWLINYPINGIPSHALENDQTILEGDKTYGVWFSGWLDRYAKEVGNFLNTTESFNDESLKSFFTAEKYAVEDSMIGEPPVWRPNEPSGWLTFNQFFARRLNPGKRPIEAPIDNHIATAPMDGQYKAAYDINEQSEVVTNGKIRIKGTHPIDTIPNLLATSTPLHQTAFACGRFVHYFLSPYSYHRFHAPVAGEVLECYTVSGTTYLDVTISGKGAFDAPDNAESGYEFRQSRGVLIIDTHDSKIGLVAIIPVGMCTVSSVNMTAAVGSTLQKGEEFGYFLFGGSDIIVLFQKDVAKTILQRPEHGPSSDPNYFHYGVKIAELNG